MSKIIKFVKENKIVVFALAVIILSFIFLALPGQFAHADLVPNKGFSTKFGGYEFIFNTKEDVLGNAYGKVVGAGVAAIVMLALSVVGLIFSNKSSFVTIVTGLMLITVSILFFTMEKSAINTYGSIHTFWYNDMYHIINWVAYVCGGLIVIAGALVVYKSIMMMKDEIKHPAKAKGPTYNYLKK